ncbi:MAG TPA: hypothetical protein VGO25_05915 [Rhodanobacteraceae bacterium]|jgi:hypothetical protein|nr:hypothetical protein [Rhodanobacteraceae bacterium]
MITVVRLPTSHGSYLLGDDLSRILGTVVGISAVSIENQFLDRATVSYDWADATRDFDRIDHLLKAKGMRRVC